MCWIGRGVVVPAAHGVRIAKPAPALGITPARAVPWLFVDGHHQCFGGFGQLLNQGGKLKFLLLQPDGGPAKIFSVAELNQTRAI
jgi:hypothetical protein